MRASTHRCTECGSQFRTAFTRASLLVIPVAALALGASYLILTFVKAHYGTHGITFGAAAGGLIGGSLGLSQKLALRTFALKQVHVAV